MEHIQSAPSLDEFLMTLRYEGIAVGPQEAASAADHPAAAAGTTADRDDPGPAAFWP